MTKYKLGEKVRIKNGDRNRVSDLEADPGDTTNHQL